MAARPSKKSAEKRTFAGCRIGIEAGYVTSFHCEQTFYRWRRKYGRMEMADAKRFKELENENTELKKMLADEMLKARVLEEALKKSMNGLREAAGSGAGRRKGCLFGLKTILENSRHSKRTISMT